jgi:hypothetical protein
MNDFYLTLPSNTSPENLTSNFSVHLPTKLDLQGKWEVALVEIQYPHSWNNIHGARENVGIGDNQIEITFQNQQKITIYIPGGYYGTIHELLAAVEYAKHKASDAISKFLKLNGKKTETGFQQKHVKDIIVGFHLEFDDTLKRVKMKLFPDMVAKVQISERLQYMLGFSNRIFHVGKKLAPFQPDVRGGFYSLYVYCSLVEPQIVGNVTAPLLRTVHIEGIHGDMIEKLYHTPHYVPVIAKEVDRIEIDIKDDKNQSVPFQFGKTVVKLHFRKKRALL